MTTWSRFRVSFYIAHSYIVLWGQFWPRLRGKHEIVKTFTFSPIAGYEPLPKCIPFPDFLSEIPPRGKKMWKCTEGYSAIEPAKSLIIQQKWKLDFVTSGKDKVKVIRGLAVLAIFLSFIRQKLKDSNKSSLRYNCFNILFQKEQKLFRYLHNPFAKEFMKLTINCK